MTALSTLAKPDLTADTNRTLIGKGVDFAEDIRMIVPLTRDFPAWHFSMLNDQDRNTAIE